MQKCWQSDPMTRPDFNTLTELIETQLESSVRRLYVDLNDSFNKQVRATKIVGSQSPDYMNMMSSSNYVNVRKSMEENKIAESSRYKMAQLNELPLL